MRLFSVIFDGKQARWKYGVVACVACRKMLSVCEAQFYEPAGRVMVKARLCEACYQKADQGVLVPKSG